MQTVGPSVNFLNLSYFFQLIYNLVFSARGSAPSLSGFENLGVELWVLITILSFLLSLVLIGMLVYYTLRLNQVTIEEDQRFSTVAPVIAHDQVEHSRWAHIKELIESSQESDWRSAIIEADIMLDEMLTRIGFEGAGVGEKLKTATPASFATLQDAWAAHRVRNEIAHQGSSYQLSEHTAYRTIGQYENVFREFHEI